MKTIIGTREELAQKIAARVAETAARRPEAAFAFAATDVPEAVYAAIAASGASFARVKAFSACEYLPVPAAHSQRAALDAQLFSKAPFAAVYAPEPNADYDAAIRAAGGLELALLGIGPRGHVAFCEPGAAFGACTGTVKLADATREAAAADFGALEQTPTQGVTMGIATLMGARKILLVAFGAARADAVQKTLEGRPESFIPASYLQLHTDVEVYLDHEAAAKLQ